MPGRPLLSRDHAVLFACLLDLVFSDVTQGFTSISWTRSEEHQTVMSSLRAISSTATTIQCVMHCVQMEACGSVAYDSSNRVCYLQPQHRAFTEEDAGPPLYVHTVDMASECKTSEAPDVPNNAHVGNWRLTSSSLEGDVTCDADFMFSFDITSGVTCLLDTGHWTVTMPAPCKRFAWRNFTGNPHDGYEDGFPLPRPAGVRWCVRINGIPTANTRFYIALVSITAGMPTNVPLLVDARLNFSGVVKTTILTSLNDGKFNLISARYLYDPWPPFPFAQEVPFEMVITAVSAYDFRVDVNGEHYATFEGGLPTSDVNMVTVMREIHVNYLIMGC